MAVTKFFPASDVRILADLGVTDVGENRHPEAGDKRAECDDLPVRWHFIGGLQSNKAAVVGSYADVVESVDRAKLVTALNRGAHERVHEVDVLLQVSLDPPGRAGRAGADPADLLALAEAVEAAGMLRLRGLMAVAPLDEDPREAFAPAGRDPRRLRRRTPRRHLAFRRDEQRPRGRDRGRGDTRACRLGNPRCTSAHRVASQPPEA